MKRRRAVSMTEMLVVLSVATVIMTISGQIMHRIMRTHAHASAFYNVQRNSFRLARQFRHDVHLANDASLDTSDNAQQLTLQRPDGRTIQYQIDHGIVTRRLSLDDDHVAHEEYRFPAETTGRFMLDASPRTVAIELQTAAAAITTSDQARRSPLFVTPVATHVIAALGQDRLLLPTAQPAEDSP